MRVLALVALLLSSSHAYAQSCAPPARNPIAPANLADGQVEVSADSLQSDDRDTVHFSGNTRIRTNDDLIRADKASYTHSTGHMNLQDAVSLEREGTKIIGSSAEYNYRLHQGSFADARFEIHNQQQAIYGTAAKFEQRDANKVVLQQSSYSSCKHPNPAWSLVANRIELDRKEDIGSASHIRLHLGGVPIFYFPYLSFPLSGARKSGMLFPSFGQSDRRGWQYYQPLYWNIAPEADATITPFVASKTGSGIESEWRYLDHIGSYDLFFDYANDKKYSREQRYVAAFVQRGEWRNWRSSINLARVSDAEYLHHYSNNAGLADEEYIPSSFELLNQSGAWQSVIGANIYQDTKQSGASQPYARLPYISSFAELPIDDIGNNQSGWQWQARLDNFAHPDKIDGQRLHLAPAIWWQRRMAAYKLGARASWWHNTYFYRNHANSPADSVSSDTVVIDLAASVNLERDYQRLRHSIEPELQLLYVPHAEQSRQMNFDSSRRSFSYNSLFARNRYFGFDRQGDAQRLTVGLNNGWYALASGKLLGELKIAQAFYAKERRVSLDHAIERDNLQQKSSDIAVQAQVELPYHLSFSHIWRYAVHPNKLAAAEYKLSYKPSAAHKIYIAKNAANRYNRDSSERFSTVETGALWQLNSRLELLLLSSYDTDRHKSEELALSLAYNACCWSVRLSGSKLLQDDKKTYDNAYYLEFTLDGLANVGRRQQLLRERIDNR